MRTSRTGTFYNRQEGLEPERQSTDEVDEGTSAMEGPTRAIQSTSVSHPHLLRGKEE